MSKREHIPVDIQRKVKVESGHRCAIPQCRQHPIEIHHIVEVSDGGSNDFENLICLCSNCHARVTRGEIGRREVELYKRNLSILTSRYGEFERRLLDRFAQAVNEHGLEKIMIRLPGGLELLYYYLLRDGLVEHVAPPRGVGYVEIAGQQFHMWCSLTQTGVDFVRTWMKAEGELE